MKYIKKVINISLIFVLLVPMFVAPYVVNAADNRTIKSILADIEAQKKALSDKKNQQTLTEAQIREVKNNITLIDANIKKGQQEVIDLNNQIAELQIEIKAKDAEMRKIVNFLEVSNGESEYLEYTFGAKTFTDFIYRMAITEQLTAYNDKLINEYNAMIESNKAKTEEIKAKELKLQSQQVELQVQISKLSTQVASLSREQGDLADAINKSEAQIRSLLADGCTENETIDACYTRTRNLPSDTEFWRPLNFGTISSLFGWRTYYLYGKEISDFHYGLDISVPVGTPVYAVANGNVANKMQWAGTGYVLYVFHKVNGVKYTSVYEHLSGYAVSPGQNVTKDTVIAYSGNTGQSSGPHLHVSIIYGWLGDGYDSYWDINYMNNNVDPKTKINFPAGYGSFTTRNRNCSLGAC
jgi:murein DD-endopeptidase MepM/ murein hydrolase activator NlpD